MRCPSRRADINALASLWQVFGDEVSNVSLLMAYCTVLDSRIVVSFLKEVLCMVASPEREDEKSKQLTDGLKSICLDAAFEPSSVMGEKPLL